MEFIKTSFWFMWRKSSKHFYNNNNTNYIKNKL